MADEGTIKVVCLAGAGRSGSTLLARLLGELPGFINIGEATAYATNSKMLAREIPCGCGAELRACSFWGPIIGSVDGEAREAAAGFVRLRSFPAMMAPVKSSAMRTALDGLSKSVAGLLTAVAERSGRRVIVDSSKNPSAAYILSEIPQIELRVIHLVRDPRGFVSSRAKPKAYLNRLPPLKATGVWLARNTAAELLRLRTSRFIRVRYEDLASNPRGVLATLGAWISGQPPTLDFIDDKTATIRVQHIIGGNPDKLASGQLSIEARGWQLPRVQHLVVTSLTFPFLLWYGYGASG